MKRVIFLFAFLAAGFARADPPEMVVSPPAGLTAVEESSAAASLSPATETPTPKPKVPRDVVPLIKGKTAPHSGLLVREQRFTEMLKAEVAAEELQGSLEIERRLRDNIESLYNEKLKEAVKPPPWYESLSFNRWTFFLLGVAATAAAIYGGAQLIKATK